LGTTFMASNVPLNPGNNSFVITGTNSAGTATASTNVIYTPAVARPTVTITIPSSNPTNVSTSSTTVRATIQNVTNRNNVSMTVNGRAVSNFMLAGTIFQANGVVLTPGNNTITVRATNAGGAASDSKVVVFTPRTTGGTTGGNTNQTGSGSSGGGNTGSGSSNAGGSSGGSSSSSAKKNVNTSNTNTRTNSSNTKAGASTKSGSSTPTESTTKKGGTTTKSATKKGGTR
jgi:hypothetical protein